MLDTEAGRLDIAEVVRRSREAPGGLTDWTIDRIQRTRFAPRPVTVLEFTILFDEDREVLVLDDDLEIDLERVPVRVPSTGRIARGPVLARCPRGCGRRARVLWFDLGVADVDLFPVCRACAGIQYATARASELDRAKIAYERLRRRFGLSKHAGHEPRPYQRRRAYQRDAERLQKARQRVKDAEVAWWRTLVRQFGGDPDKDPPSSPKT